MDFEHTTILVTAHSIFWMSQGFVNPSGIQIHALTRWQHAIGHICGFARTTPDTFVFMGADCCHFAGMIRPSRYNPLPSVIPPEQLDAHHPKPCPCTYFTALHPAAGQGDFEARIQPFYRISTAPGSAYSFADAAQKTVKLLQLLDANPNVFVCLAHDGALFDMLPLYNSDPKCDINDWKEKVYDQRVRWGFLREMPDSEHRPGRGWLVPPMVLEGKFDRLEGTDGS